MIIYFHIGSFPRNRFARKKDHKALGVWNVRVMGKGW